jgi:hypothetical protein
MLTSYNESYHTWVFAESSSMGDRMPVGRLVDFVIDRESGRFQAVWIQTSQGLRLLLPRDIRHWYQGELWIDSDEDLYRVQDLPRVQKILDREVPILGARVYVEMEKKSLGRVMDFGFDTIRPQLLSIRVEKGFLWWRSKKFLERKAIHRITAEGIFVYRSGLRVHTDEKKVKSAPPQKLPEIDCKKK